jgi:hypothetical protein
MVYSEKLVLAVKVNGKVLREDGDLVILPFGSEYSLLVKNLDSVRMEFNLSIDGAPAVQKIVVTSNSSVELERYHMNGNMECGNRFKFIERTAQIEKHRGIGTEDGLLRLEAWRERAKKFVDVPIPRYYDEPAPVPRPYYPYPPRPPRWPRPWRGGPTMASLRPSAMGQSQMRGSPVRGRSSGQTQATDVGITVPGGESRQRFRYVPGFPVEPQSIVIVLRLRGEIDGKIVSEPVTVNLKPTCVTCGKTNKAGNKFCAGCGTALEII